MLFYAIIGLFQVVALGFQIASYARLLSITCTGVTNLYTMPLSGAILNVVSLMLCGVYFGLVRKKRAYDPVDEPIKQSVSARILRTLWISVFLLSYACSAAAVSDVMHKDYLCPELTPPDYFAAIAFVILSILIPLAHNGPAKLR